MTAYVAAFGAMSTAWASSGTVPNPPSILQHEAQAGSAEAAYRLGMQYYDETGHTPDYAKAIHWLTVSAKRNYPQAQAQAQMGYMYQEGYGVPANLAIAKHWFTVAAAQGDSSAMNGLGDLYLHGRGVTLDYAKARSWFEKSAAAHNSAAQANLGWMYFNGLGMPIDCAKAVGLYRESILQNDPAGENNLAVAHFFGCGVRKSNIAALKWALIADRSIITTPGEVTQDNRAQVTRNIANLKDRMAAAQIKQAESKATAWSPTAGN